MYIPSFSSLEAHADDPQSTEPPVPTSPSLCARGAGRRAHTHLVLTHPVALVQEDLVPREVVLAGRVVVEAVILPSSVLELNKT